MILRGSRSRRRRRGKPRASGDDPWISTGANTLWSVNPARAGMIPRRAISAGRTSSKPRASGDDPKSIVLNYGATR